MPRPLRATLLAACLVLFGGAEIAVAGTPVSLFQSFAGNLQFTGTAGTFRSQSNAGNACALNATAPATLSGLPAGASVQAAYLYWAGSMLNATDVDTTVTFQTPAATSNLTADRTFTETFTLGGTNYRFFSGFEDVTALVGAAGNGAYTLSNLTVHTGSPHCGSQAVVAGWSLVVVYGRAAEPLRVINVFDGFEFFRGSAINLTPSNFMTPPSPDGRIGHISWEGDIENSSDLGGFSEALRFEGNTLTDGQNPSNNQFNSTVNLTGSNGVYGVDFDVYDVTSLMDPAGGETSYSSTYSSGADLVLLTAEVISVTNTPVADLAISKTHSGDFGIGVQGTYTILISNNGPGAEPGPITVTDTLPAGLAFVAASGSGWTCGESAGTVTCTHPGPLAESATLPAISLDVLPDASAAPSVVNTAAVSGTLYDHVAGNDSSSDTTAVVGVPDVLVMKSVVVLSDPVLGTSQPKAIPGATVEYTVSVFNAGTATATAPDVVVTDSLAGEIGAGTLLFDPDAYGSGLGIRVTAPSIGGGAPTALTNATDGDTGDFSADTVTVSGIALDPGESATVTFRAVLQ